MADASDNGARAPETAQPGLSILVQYVKDLSFENPDAPNALRPRERAPSINVGINVTANPMSQTDFEVELKLEARATDNAATLFAIELVYCGVFRLTNIPQDQLHPLIMIECPRLLFPFARQIIADCSRNGGFPPLLLDPVDFTTLYRQRLAAQQEQAQVRPS